MIEMLLITGNGFDRDLGYKTSYYDFMMSNSWKNLQSAKKEGGKHSLLRFIDKSFRNNRDFNVEECLANYLKQLKIGELIGNPIEDKNDFEKLKLEMTRYLKSEFDKIGNDYYYTKAGRLAKVYSDYLPDYVYTFNITDIDIIPFFSGGFNSLFANYVHKDKKGSLVLGIDDDCINESVLDYSFLKKSYQTGDTINKMKNDLLKAKEVIAFGLSFSKSDIKYFYEYGQSLNKKQYFFRRFTIITKGIESKERIIKEFDNIGVNIYACEECNTHVDFILTDNIDLVLCKPSSDYMLFLSLIDRIDSLNFNK